jgi:hypothetical protein
MPDGSSLDRSHCVQQSLAKTMSATPPMQTARMAVFFGAETRLSGGDGAGT